ncbi:GNAT family N-acetyltransferase [Candidatus Halobonum tyrrellensis]|uniref:Phosphinothricin acetyltransferase n=1 Tax=Candidatus Halobonum tyrrellensis G22 TaxID=1324957 RepID=V4HIG5_9EURY|nr:GNAT family N-acetyltransferase [Candidatus Halobonum tyrrellensis]ESP89563.1 phosphinothricin acetyltransferase [Candidatus Halobonum tyrrellensis G22]
MTRSIRPVESGDAPDIVDIYAPFVTDSWVSFAETPPDAADVRERIAETTERFPWPVCARDDGSVCGYAYAHVYRGRGAYRWSVESSVYVAEDARRAGVATALYESLFALLRLQGFVNAYAVTALPNPASTGFHDAMGFEPVGTHERAGYKLGAWRDVRWWHRSLGDHPADPDPPADAAALRGTDEWTAATATGEASLDG